MSQPLVSVVIPAYNAEKTIDACLQSILAQSWQNLEVIVVDDGSPDGTLAAAQARAATDPRVQVYTKKQGGVSSTRNLGLDHCTGKYVRFVDADDLLPIGAIELSVNRMEATGCDLVIGGYYQRLGKLENERNLEKRSDTVPCEFLLIRLNTKANSFFYGVLWNKLFRRDLIEKQQVRFRDGTSWGEDFIFVCDYCAGVKKVSYMKEPLYIYVRNPKGLVARQFLQSLRHPIKNIRMKFKLYDALKRLFQKRGKFEEYRRVLWLYLVRFTIDE